MNLVNEAIKTQFQKGTIKENFANQQMLLTSGS